MRPAVNWVLGILFFAGCSHRGFQSDKSFKALHIFGIGWIMDKSGTNKVRAFGIGSLDATAFQASVNTNAPREITTRPATLRTNDPNPIAVPVKAPY